MLIGEVKALFVEPKHNINTLYFQLSTGNHQKMKIVPKRKILPSFDERNMDKTQTARFTLFLIKIGFIPINLNKEKDQVSFDFWSKPTMYHFLILSPCFILNFYLFYVLLFETDFESMVEQFTTIEQVSLMASSLLGWSLIFPFLIAQGLASSSVHSTLIITSHFSFPQKGKHLIIGFFIILMGNFSFNYGVFNKGQVSDDILLKSVVLVMLVALIFCCFWTFSSFLTAVWVQSLIKEHRDTTTIR